MPFVKDLSEEFGEITFAKFDTTGTHAVSFRFVFLFAFWRAFSFTSGMLAGWFKLKTRN